MDLKEVTQEELYEQFQEWLNQCPIKITDYTDNATEFAVDFSLEIDEQLETVSDNINKPEVFIPNFHD